MHTKSFYKIVEYYRYHHLLGIISVSCVIKFLQCSHAQRYLQSLYLFLPFVEWNSGPRRTRNFFKQFFSPCSTLPASFPSPSFAMWQGEGCPLLSQIFISNLLFPSSMVNQFHSCEGRNNSFLILT